MRIAVVEISSYGGILHYAGQLADALAERGHDVDLLAPRENELSGRLVSARMRAVLTAPVRGASAPRSGVAGVLRRARIALRLGRTWVRLMGESGRGRYDAVIIAADLGLSLSAAAALVLTARPRRALLLDVCHNVRPFNRWSGSDLYEGSALLTRLLTRLYPRFDRVLVHGERSLAEYRETWAAENGAVIPHGDERVFGTEPPPPSPERRILFFGDWRKVKGLDVLQEAFDLLVVRVPDVTLTVAGTPSPDVDPEAVRAWASGHGSRVELIDRYVPIDEVGGVFARARVVVTPYRTGYQSGVVHLAMTMARAVVTSDVGDLAGTVIDGESGLVVEPGQPQQLADALEQVVLDAELARRLGAHGHARLLESSSWATVALRVDQELEALAAG